MLRQCRSRVDTAGANKWSEDGDSRIHVEMEAGGGVASKSDAVRQPHIWVANFTARSQGYGSPLRASSARFTPS